MYAVNEGIVSTSQPGIGKDVSSSFGETKAGRFNWGIIAAVLLPVVILFIAVIVLILINMRSEPDNIIPSSSEIRWEELASLPVSNSGMAVAVVENNIYSIGGETESGITNRLEKYDPQADKWVSKAPKPTSAADIGAAVIGNLIYVPGGVTESGKIVDALEIYDPRSDSWFTGAPVPRALSSYAIAAYEGKLYLFGGWDGDNYLSQVFEYDPEEDAWQEKTPLPSARRDASAVSTSGNIYVIGGYDGSKALDNVDIYTPSIDKESEYPWRSAVPLPAGRFAMEAVEITGVIYVVGGENGSEQALSPVSYRIQEQTWQILANSSNDEWTKMGLASIGPEIYAVGGERNGQLSDFTLAYQVLYITVLPIVP